MIRKFSATPTINTVQYSAGDLLGTKMTFDLSAYKASKGELVLDNVLITDLAKQETDVDLVLFGSNPSGTTFTNNSALAVADADMAKILAVIPITTHVPFSDNSASIARALDLAMQLDPTQASLNLYGALIARETPTFATAADLVVNLTFRAAK